MRVADFEENGYCVLEFDRRSVLRVQGALLEAARQFLGVSDLPNLESCHHVLGADPQAHTNLQTHVTEALRRERWHIDILRTNVSRLAEIVGPDIDVEISPYLRLVRPHRVEDNIGFHRDTVYGASPYELSVFVPFVDLDERATIRIEPGSHLKAEGAIPFTRRDNLDPSIVKGSPKHRLGYPYAPQQLDPRYPAAMTPIPLRVGQALAFSLAELHGTVVNLSEGTRWSCDTRIINPFAPLQRVKPGVYTELSRGPVTRAAQRYLDACARWEKKA